jgi:hypothetical protein
MSRPSRFALGALCIAVSVACGGKNPTDLFPSRFEAVSPTSVTAKAGSAVTLQVRVLTDKGETLANIPVIWTPAQGDVLPSTSRTDSVGIATTIWTLWPQVGQQSVTATAQFVSPLTFTANATQ